LLYKPIYETFKANHTEIVELCEYQFGFRKPNVYVSH